MRVSLFPVQQPKRVFSPRANKSVLFSGQKQNIENVLETQYTIEGKGTFTGLDVLKMVQNALKKGSLEDKFFGIYMDAIFQGLHPTQVDAALVPLDALEQAGYLEWNQPDTAYRYKLTHKGKDALKH